MSEQTDVTCQSCGKTISRRAIANVMSGGLVVCTACKHKIEHEHERAARPKPLPEPAYDENEPTPRQIAFAEYLGIHIPPGISKWALSDLIDKAKANREAEQFEAALNARVQRALPSRSATKTPPYGLIGFAAIGVIVIIILLCAGVTHGW